MIRPSWAERQRQALALDVAELHYQLTDVGRPFHALADTAERIAAEMRLCSKTIGKYDTGRPLTEAEDTA